MYTNIPTDELLTIIETTCKNYDVEEGLKRDILKLLKIVTDQNYFQFMGHTYVWSRWSSHGRTNVLHTARVLPPTPGKIKNCDILLNFSIMGYFRYVDDLLIIYNERKTGIEDLLCCFNNITPKLNFTIEKETRGSINFLDVTIHRDVNRFSIDIQRKPTYTDSVIPIDSCHPIEHKYGAIRYLHYRLNSYQLSHEKKEEESKIIEDILHNNG